MPPLHDTPPPALQAFQAEATLRRRAFTLVELLCVMTVISLLIALGVRSLATTGGSDINNSIIDVSNALESARQLAIARNSYAYVGFTSPTNIQNVNTPLCVAVFLSNTGEDIVRNAILGGPTVQDETTASTSKQWELVRKPQWLRNTLVDGSNSPEPGLVPSEELINGQFSDSLRPLIGGLAFRLSRQTGDMKTKSTLAFDRIVTFTPSGAAYVDNSSALPVGLIGFQLRPSRGQTPTDIEKKGTAALTISGLLGSSQVHQFGTH